MIHVRYSNRVEALVAGLAAALPTPGDPVALFGGPWLIVPSRALELYVDLELARRRGISGNLDTLSWRGAFARLCTGAFPDLVVIERGHIVGELLAALSEPAVIDGHGAFAPLAAYLLGAGPDVDAVDRRRSDLARALGKLFDDWGTTAPERLAAWRTPEPGSRAESATVTATPTAKAKGTPALERAERALWDAVFGPEGRFVRRGAAESKRYLTLNDVLARDLDEAWRAPPAVHVFGLTGLTRGMQLALARLGARTDVFVYAVSPCGEFWEDVNTRRRRPSPAASAAPVLPPPSRISPRAPAPAPASRRSVERPPSRQLELTGLASSPVVSPPASVVVGGAGGATDGDERDHDNPFLRLWGHAGRESTRLLEQVSDGNSQVDLVPPAAGATSGASLFELPAETGPGARPPVGGDGPDGASGGERPATLLSCVQRDMLERAPLREGARRLALAADGSIAVIGAPNPRRELETVAAQIWDLVRRTDTALQPLRFSDFAVMVAGPDEPYLSLARPVFHEAGNLPHNIVDAPLTASTHLVEAVLSLLALPLTNLTRREVLDVITHPNVRARFPEADPGVWLELCAALAIAHGADQRALSDTYIDGDLFNWDQGLKRLALGVFARGARSGAFEPIEVSGPDDGDNAGAGAGADTAPATSYMPAEVGAELLPHAQSMALLLRSLLADARFARHARLSLPDWTRFVRASIAAYVVPTSAADEAARLLVFTTLDELASQSAPDLKVGLTTAVELVRDALAGLRGSHGQILGAGVAVGPLASLRTVPFRVVFVVGLDPQRFPSSDRSSPFDLPVAGAQAAGSPLTGDVSPRQQDRGLFLDAVLAARERLVLSHLDRDALTGQSREPSPVILELLDQLGRGYLREGTSIVGRVPLHRDDDALARAAFPAAAAEFQARAVGDRLRADVPETSRWGPAIITRSLSADARRSLAPLLGLVEAPPAPDESAHDDDRGRPRVLRLVDLRRFLECPLQGSARIFLGLRDLPDDSDEREMEDEPFDVPRMLERNFLIDVFTDAWRGDLPPRADVLGACYDVGPARRRRERLLPAGLFRTNVRRRHLRILEQWTAALAALANRPTGPARRVCFGRPQPFAPPAEARAAIRLRIDRAGRTPLDVELHGTTEPRVSGGAMAAAAVLATSDDNNRYEKDDRDALRAFLDHVALAAAAAEDIAPAPSAAIVCRPSSRGTQDPRATVMEFDALTVADARAYLGSLVAEMLTGVHAYLFPCEAVWRSLDGTMSLVDRVDQVRSDDHYRRHSSSGHGPVPDPFDYPTPSAPQADAMLKARFGLFLRHHRSTVEKDGAGGVGRDKKRGKR